MIVSVGPGPIFGHASRHFAMTALLSKQMVYVPGHEEGPP